jgi:hypothetical protein
MVNKSGNNLSFNKQADHTNLNLNYPFDNALATLSPLKALKEIISQAT